ncbi:DUF1876 domain-containing protein [Streptomyces sp. NA02950]|nr:DUF1876 domain-containing protein [Streptomyces sp. NA02950]
MHTVEWKIHLHLFEDEGTTKARVVLDTNDTSLTGHGAARCHPEDPDVPEIGDELAAGRALHDLGEQLLVAAEHDIEGIGRPPVPGPGRHGNGPHDRSAHHALPRAPGRRDVAAGALRSCLDHDRDA